MASAENFVTSDWEEGDDTAICLKNTDTISTLSSLSSRYKYEYIALHSHLKSDFILVPVSLRLSDHPIIKFEC